MKYLSDYLKENAASDIYPFHMPGHKRRAVSAFANPYEADITEIDGFDNLHRAEGIIRDAEERAAGLYGSDRCYYLVNGSTCGLLAAICAAAGRGSRVIAARNCHKAVYHAIYVNQLRAEYLYPQVTECGVQGQITAAQVENALQQYPDAAAVILTSPTYEGVVSDVQTIAQICHARGIPLIVDEAHGAHFGLGAGFPDNAVRLGADAVIMSLHKTLPSFTQTALLHLNGARIDARRVEWFLDIFETSSPSYLFMAGMDDCVRLLAEDGERLFSDYRKKLNDFYEKTADLQKLHVLRRADFGGAEAFDWDDSKLVIFSGGNRTGEELHEALLHRYRLQMEMVSGYYVLGMTSIMDDADGFARLSDALHELDGECADSAQNGGSAQKDGGVCMTEQRNRLRHIQSGNVPQLSKQFIEKIYQENPRALPFSEAKELPSARVPLAEAAGRMAACTVCLYPPGVPLLVPGEVITERLIGAIADCLAIGLHVEGVEYGEVEVVI